MFWIGWAYAYIQPSAFQGILSQTIGVIRIVVRLSRVPQRITPAPSRVRAAPKVAQRFYSSPEWIALRDARRKDADYRVALKRRVDPRERVILDHVREIKDGGAPLDPKNTQWLTFTEHQAKTEREKRRRAGLG